MRYRFDTRRPHVYVNGRLTGPRGETDLQLALDTGAMRTVIRPWFLRYVGWDMVNPIGRMRMVSATGETQVPIVRITKLVCLSYEGFAKDIASYDLPARFQGDGLLGLDVLRAAGFLGIDFHAGTISLAPPRPWWRVWR